MLKKKRNDARPYFSAINCRAGSAANKSYFKTNEASGKRQKNHLYCPKRIAKADSLREL
jgi:hypothetical protein